MVNFLTLPRGISYAKYMIYLLLLASFVSGFITIKIIASPAAAEQKSSLMHEYFSKKNTPVATKNQANSFAQLLSSPVSVLGESTESAELIQNNQQSDPDLKAQYTIALLGDSMIDTLGRDLPHLKQALKERYPTISFTLLNYGVGASNIEHGKDRLTNGYTYLGESKPPLLSQNPDIIIIESFAYNHWNNNQSDLDRQWLTIAKIIDTIKQHNPQTKIVLASTIAPYCPTYTNGSANLAEPYKFIACTTAKAYLKNMVNFATSQNYPLADAYHPSLQSDGNGAPKYINQGDHIHPSDAGKALFAEKVVEAISL